MAWQTNPTFATDDVLSASDLNKLSDNADFLYARIQGINVPFSSVRVSDTDLDATNNAWAIRHKHDYLHYKLELISGSIAGSDLSIYYNAGTKLVDVETSPTELAIAQVWEDKVDVSGWTVGDWYTLYITADYDTAAVFQVHYLVESDETSI